MWGEAVRFVRLKGRPLLLGLWAPALAIVLVNLHWLYRPWLSGFLTATILAGIIWAFAWLGWVSSGLAFRIQGALAEDWTAELFRSLPNVYKVIPSWKYDSADVDHIVLTPKLILVVETKWRSAAPSKVDMAYPAHQAERGAQRLRHELTNLERARVLRRDHSHRHPLGAEDLR